MSGVGENAPERRNGDKDSRAGGGAGAVGGGAVGSSAAGAGAAGAPDVMPDQIGHLPSRILVSVPKRFFKRAVKRNLLKRRIREAYRQQKIDGVDVMFQYNSQEIADSATIFREIGAILKRITDALQEGENRLEVEVTNTWPNRLIGDQQPDCPRKITYTSYPFYKQDSKLRPAGLLGPVVIECEE